MFPHSQSHDLVVGCAWTFKKKKSFLQPKLLCLARNKGIFFVAIDLYRPLSDQGPFMLFYIRITGKKILKLTVLEPPYAIEHLHNRHSMLQDVADLNLSDCHETRADCVGWSRYVFFSAYAFPRLFPGTTCEVAAKVQERKEPIEVMQRPKSLGLGMEFSNSNEDPPSSKELKFPTPGVYFESRS